MVGVDVIPHGVPKQGSQMVYMNCLLCPGGLVKNHGCHRRFKVDDLVHGAPVLEELGRSLLGMLGIEVPHIVANLQLWWRSSSVVVSLLSIPLEMGVLFHQSECLMEALQLLGRVVLSVVVQLGFEVCVRREISFSAIYAHKRALFCALVWGHPIGIEDRADMIDPVGVVLVLHPFHEALAEDPVEPLDSAVAPRAVRQCADSPYS